MLLLVYQECLDDGDEENGTEWIQLINRSGLTLVKNRTFKVFVASMSCESTYVKEVCTIWIRLPVR